VSTRSDLKHFALLELVEIPAVFDGQSIDDQSQGRSPSLQNPEITMLKVVRTELADEDLLEIWFYIVADDMDAEIVTIKLSPCEAAHLFSHSLRTISPWLPMILAPLSALIPPSNAASQKFPPTNQEY
jgi:hypothetical protein